MDEHQKIKSNIVTWLRKVNQVHKSMLDDPRFEHHRQRLQIRHEELNYIIGMIESRSFR